VKICLVGAELLQANNRTDERTERQTDRHDETNILFREFCEDA